MHVCQMNRNVEITTCMVQKKVSVWGAKILILMRYSKCSLGEEEIHSKTYLVEEVVVDSSTTNNGWVQVVVTTQQRMMIRMVLLLLFLLLLLRAIELSLSLI